VTEGLVVSIILTRHWDIEKAEHVERVETLEQRAAYGPLTDLVRPALLTVPQ